MYLKVVWIFLYHYITLVNWKKKVPCETIALQSLRLQVNEKFVPIFECSIYGFWKNTSNIIIRCSKKQERNNSHSFIASKNNVSLILYFFQQLLINKTAIYFCNRICAILWAEFRVSSRSGSKLIVVWRPPCKLICWVG